MRGPCPRCTKARQGEHDATRESAAARGYDHRWRAVTRPGFLQENPLCVLCGALAEVPDHWPVTRRELVERGVSDPDAYARMRALCLSCHAIHGLR